MAAGLAFSLQPVTVTVTVTGRAYFSYPGDGRIPGRNALQEAPQPGTQPPEVVRRGFFDQNNETYILLNDPVTDE